METNTTKRTNKATHTGHCQCCGRSQMLPGGVLSKHGYTVDLGFFNGTCQGAGELPFEISKALVEKFIALAERQRDGLQAAQAELRKPATKPMAWVHEYKPATWARGDRRSSHVWREVEITRSQNTYQAGTPTEFTVSTYSYVDMTGKPAKIDIYDYAASAAGVLAVCTVLNGKRADAYDKTIEQITTYIGWQRARIANWKPEPLTPIK